MFVSVPTAAELTRLPLLVLAGAEMSSVDRRALVLEVVRLRRAVAPLRETPSSVTP